tara:strand:+ start:245 stop:667 length:423 start_codon:yes stop_codon:yes gene_type:complete
MSIEYKILTEFIKDISFETPDIETYLFVKDNLSKYSLNIDINSTAVKNKVIQINTILRFQDKNLANKRSNFEITYATIVKLEGEIENKKELERIILSKIPKIIYPKLETIFLSLIKNSGFPEIKLKEKVDIEKLYNEKLN